MTGGEIGDFKIADVEQIRLILQDAENQLQAAINEMDYCDRKTQDILHDLELQQHSYHETAKLAVELTDIRRRRRNAKNTQELLGPLVKWKQDNSGPLIKLQNAIGKMKSINDIQKTAEYTRKADNAGEKIGHWEE